MLLIVIININKLVLKGVIKDLLGKHK